MPELLGWGSKLVAAVLLLVCTKCVDCTFTSGNPVDVEESSSYLTYVEGTYKNTHTHIHIASHDTVFCDRIPHVLTLFSPCRSYNFRTPYRQLHLSY